MRYLRKVWVFTFVIGSVFIGFLPDSIVLAGSNQKCAKILDLVEIRAISEKFSGFYKSEFGASNYRAFSHLSKLEIFDCGYFQIVETRVRSPQVFGPDTAYFFSARSFEYLGSVLIQ